MANKVKFGLKNVHVYEIEKNDHTGTTYKAGFRIPGAVDLVLSAQGSENIFHADDMVYWGAFTNGGYSGDLEIALIPEKFEIDIMGNTKDSNGAIVESIDAKPKPFAMAFEFSGDANAVRHILYNVAASRPDIAGHTVEDKTDPKTDKIKIIASAKNDGVIKAKLEQGQTGYDTFFDAPYVVTP